MFGTTLSIRVRVELPSVEGSVVWILTKMLDNVEVHEHLCFQPIWLHFRAAQFPGALAGGLQNSNYEHVPRHPASRSTMLACAIFNACDLPGLLVTYILEFCIYSRERGLAEILTSPRPLLEVGK